ncbi:MAG: hypothetical protein AAF340_00580 [Pseudomonadota bacterium]
MADQPGMKVNGANALLLAGIAAIVLAVFFVFVQGQSTEEDISEGAPEPAPKSETETVVASQPEGAEETAVADTAVTSEAEDAPSEETIAEQVEPEAPAPVSPTFDLVRIDPTGSAVIAGSADPGATVRLMAGGETLAETVADASGKFVALFDLAPSSDPRSLSAEFDSASGEVIASAGTVLIAPIALPEPVVVAEAEPDTATALAEEGAGLDVSDTASVPVISDETVTDAAAATDANDDAEIATDVAQSPVSEDAAPTQEQVASLSETNADSAASDDQGLDTASAQDPATGVQAEATGDVATSEPPVVIADGDAPEPDQPEIADSPTIVLADESGVKILQPAPQPVAPKLAPAEDEKQVANLVIDTITYDAEGEVALSGRGAGESFARVYVDDTVIKTVPIQPDGTWDAPLPEIDAGIYKLRIDELDAEGAVTSRVETPFQRETPEVVAEAATRANAVTVQKGFTLWAIARDRFGDGTQYVRVYEANRDLIRDPDLIYPGQIFELPEG